MRENPDWAVVLEYLYQHQTADLGANLKRPDSVTLNHHSDLRDDLTLSHDEIEGALEYLVQTGLLEASSVGNPLELTSLGFQVAHERQMQARREQQEDRRLQRRQEREDRRIELQEQREDKRNKRQHEVNRAIAFLTLGLMTVTVVDSAVRVFVGMDRFGGAQVAVVAGFILVLGVAGILQYFGLLSDLPTRDN